MTWIVPQKGDYINIIDCFDCHRQSAFRCFNLNCDRKPIVHRYCKRCAEEYKKRPEDDCPGCAAALIAMEKSREEVSG
ncbi:hypothetical protein PRIPAC_95853 [Pristionchus pacificus]|uniref:Uncharacterized protein n=1 Tax=Pristionchus pacificus TaxID=54126 RepID=A0A2A6BDJ1_PRIPA|nr:hypothetical protein PRIPAC_95853 [Pristionchus pacificus]|eukprot:PDM63944.1 hypothetical protein PRIPAC_49445 [Pristionchus pacificus]